MGARPWGHAGSEGTGEQHLDRRPPRILILRHFLDNHRSECPLRRRLPTPDRRKETLR